jgi:hypothetical protein
MALFPLKDIGHTRHVPLCPLPWTVEPLVNGHAHLRPDKYVCLKEVSPLIGVNNNIEVFWHLV